MCDMRTFNRIESILETKMAAGEMFTAFDITLALQKKRMRRPHREIRRDIRRAADALMWRFGYERTPVRFEEVRASAFVYHPYGTDPSLHRPSIGPRALAPANTGRALGLSMDGKTGAVIDVVTGLFVIIKRGDPDPN